MAEMVTLLVLAAFITILVRINRRSLEAQGQTPPTMKQRFQTWTSGMTTRQRKTLLRSAIAAVVGFAAIPAGGLVAGMWGMALGVAVLTAGLAWAAAPNRSGRASGGDLTEEERRAFEDIISQLQDD